MLMAYADRAPFWGSGNPFLFYAAPGGASPVPLRATGTGFAATGNVSIDGLLQGTMWSGPITYGFPIAAGDYEMSYGAGEPMNGFRAVSFAQMQAARMILDGTSPSAGGPRMALMPVEGFTRAVLIESGRGLADIRIAQSASADPTAYAYLPGAREGGDVWFGRSYDYTAPRVGNYAFDTMLHELGHALGLKHGHELGGVAGIALPASQDSLEYSVMTYYSYVPSIGEALPAGGYTNEEYGFPQTYMMDDIAALQAMYGANFNFRSDNTVYRWSPTTGETSVNGVGQGVPGLGAGGGQNRIFLTIWDGGGNDTYDLSNYASGVRVDLTPGGYSSTGLAQRADLGGGHLARGNIFNARQSAGDPRSLIENAYGGSGPDTVIGNTAANVLCGNAGNDVLYGRAGNDTLYGGAGRDAFVFNTALNPSRNVDRVVDFFAPDDTLRLHHTVFTAAGPIGGLGSAAFFRGAQAHDPTDRIVYDPATGALSYDPDGTGVAAALRFAQLKAGLAVTAADFAIV